MTYLIKYVFRKNPEDLNQHDCRNEWVETLTKNICEFKCKFDGRKCNSNLWWNNNYCWCKCRKHHISEKDYIWNPATYSFQNGKYLTSIIDDSVVTWDGTVDVEAKSNDEETKTIPINFDKIC